MLKTLCLLSFRSVISIPSRHVAKINPLRSRILPLSGKMSSLHVRNLEDEERLQINIDLKAGEMIKTFTLNRFKNEELGSCFERLKASFDKKLIKRKAKKMKKRKEHVDTEEVELEDIPISVEILHNGIPIPISTMNEKAWIEGAILSIEGENLTVSVNPPSVKLKKLCALIMEGFPLFPDAEFEFCDLKSCEFYWKIVEKEQIFTINMNMKKGIFDLSDTYQGISYTPATNDLGKHVLLICVPLNREKKGRIQTILSESPVVTGPVKCPFERRHEMFTQQRSSPGEFRVISYNILAETYTETKEGKDYLFAHLPHANLEMNYRKQLLLKEITGYQGDVVCLQEVDKSVFKSFLKPGLELLGYQGFFTPKKDNSEGGATFIRLDKFKVVNHTHIVLSDYLATDQSCQDLWDKVCQVEALKEKVASRSSILQVTVVESMEKPDQYLLVANTHFYFHPLSCNIRLILAATALRYLQAVCAAYAQEGKKIGFVFCGDFNSSPDVGVYQLMTTGFVQEDHADWLSGGEKEAIQDVVLSHPLNIVSACGTPDFTHYGAPIQCTLDYIYVETSQIDVVSSVPLIDLADVTTHTFLPNPLVPSDHLALVSDLKFKL